MSENDKVKQIMALLDKLTPEEKELFDEFWDMDKWDRWQGQDDIPTGMVTLPPSVAITTGLSDFEETNVRLGTTLYEPANSFNVTDIGLYTSLLKEAQTPNFGVDLHPFTGLFKVYTKKEVK